MPCLSLSGVPSWFGSQSCNYPNQSRKKWIREIALEGCSRTVVHFRHRVKGQGSTVTARSLNGSNFAILFFDVFWTMWFSRAHTQPEVENTSLVICPSKCRYSRQQFERYKVMFHEFDEDGTCLKTPKIMSSEWLVPVPFHQTQVAVRSRLGSSESISSRKYGQMEWENYCCRYRMTQ